MSNPDQHWLLSIHEKVAALADGGEVYENILEFLEANMRFPSSDRSKRFRRETSPWLNDILMSIESGRFHTISLLGAVGSGKTALIECFLVWMFSQAPGDTLLVCQSDSDAQDFCETRLWRSFEACPALQPLLSGLAADSRRKMALISPVCNVWATGGNENSLQGRSCRYLVSDESWLLASGMLTEAIARTHSRKDRLSLITGQGGTKFDEHWHVHERCGQNDWAWKCPNCGSVSVYDFHQLAFEVVKNARNEMDRLATAATVRLVCSSCQTAFLDKPDVRAQLQGLYVPVESNPMPGAILYRVPSVALPHVRWSDLVLQHEDAVERMRQGDNSEIRAFKQKVEAKFWDDIGTTPKRKLITQDCSLHDFEHGELCQGEVVRIMEVDFQTLKRYATIRAWTTNNDSFLIACKELDSDEAVVEMQQQYLVHPSMTLLDVGFDPYRVGMFAYNHGYRCLRGSGKASWPITNNVGRTVEHPFSAEQYALIRGFQIPYVAFSSFYFRDQLENLLSNPAFGIPRDTPTFYAENLAAERKVMRYTVTAPPHPIYELKPHAECHCADTEKMCLVPLAQNRISL